MLVGVYTCQNATLLEITCHASNIYKFMRNIFCLFGSLMLLFQVNISELGLVTQGGKVVWGRLYDCDLNCVF